MVLPFQSGYLYTGLQNTHVIEDILLSVPDLISLIGSDGYTLGTQDIKYAIRVNLVAFVARPLCTQSKVLGLAGQRS